MRTFGRISAYEFLENRIVFRNLVPLDNRIPSMKEVIHTLGIETVAFPRKTSIDYARIITYQLQYARVLELTKGNITKIVYVGDTYLNDGTAYSNICNVSNMDGIGIIISEKKEQPSVEFKQYNSKPIIVANRWNILLEYTNYFRDLNFQFDEQTALILDLDKTVIGARGRNDHIIDKARLNAAHLIANDLLGSTYDRLSFQKTYDLFDNDEYHQFTTDNVDYLVYICLITGDGFISPDVLKQKILSGNLKNFLQFVHEVDTNAKKLSKPLHEAHKEFFECIQSGDPTPFKAFRKQEYKNTIDLMGKSQDDSSIEYLINHEIVLTQEVRQFANYCHENGALVFGLSDKPDEASLPDPELQLEGYMPIHQTVTHAVGEC